MTQPGTPTNPKYDFAERVLNVRMYPEALPPALPLQLPIPPDSHVVGSVFHPQVGSLAEQRSSGMLYRGERFDVVFAVAGTTADVLTFYEPVFAEQDWHRAWPATDPSTIRSFHREQYHNADWQTLTLVTDQDRAPGEVHLTLDMTLRSSPSSSYLKLIRTIPPLIAPPDGRLPFLDIDEVLGPYRALVRRGFSHGRYEQITTKDIVVETDMNATQLDAHVYKQLRGEGWQCLDGGAEGPIAWSRWAVTGGPDRQGWVVIRPGILPDYLDVSIWVSWIDQIGEPRQ
jgi:hypothetical protein